MIHELVRDPWSILVVAAVIILIAVLYFIGKKKEATKLALHFIEIAEDLLGPKKGEEKHWYVVEHLYLMLPKILKLIYSKENISLFIERIFETTKYYLKNI